MILRNIAAIGSRSSRSVIAVVALSLLTTSALSLRAQQTTDSAAGRARIKLESGKLIQPRMLDDINKYIVYPAAAAKAGKEGMAVFTTLIGEKGDLEKIKLNSCSDSVFVAPALAAIKKVRFAPATQDGVPIKAWVQIPVHFKLHRKDE